MAESQVVYDYGSKTDKLKLCLSNERFAPYLIKAGHDDTFAFNLYLYNARLSKAFLFPLHILEVSLRNRINLLFSKKYRGDWPKDPAFQSILTSESLSSLNTAIERANTSKTEDIVATLSFDFWSNLFRPDYDRSIWQTQMRNLLPNENLTRRTFQNVVKDINRFRNRVAHHEPIHHMDISKFHSTIIDVIGWICVDTQDWVKHHSTVHQVIRTAPSASGEAKPHFIERCDTNFKIVRSDLALRDLPKERFMVVVSVEGDVEAVIESLHLSLFLMSKLDEDGASIMIDLRDYTFSELIKNLNVYKNFNFCGGTESLGKARELFKGARSSYILVKDQENIAGVIAKSHRRY